MQGHPRCPYLDRARPNRGAVKEQETGWRFFIFLFRLGMSNGVSWMEGKRGGH